MKKCREVSQLLSEGLDRPLSVSEKASMHVHVLMCSACRRYGKQLKLLRIFTKEYSRRACVDTSRPDQ